MIINAYKETRHIYTDGRAHAAARRPVAYRDRALRSAAGRARRWWSRRSWSPSRTQFFQGAAPLASRHAIASASWLDGNTLRRRMDDRGSGTPCPPRGRRASRWVRDEAFDRMIQVNWNNDRTGTDGELQHHRAARRQRESHEQPPLKIAAWHWRRCARIARRSPRASRRPRSTVDIAAIPGVVSSDAQVAHATGRVR